jgi:hypothetical protein
MSRRNLPQEGPHVSSKLDFRVHCLCLVWRSFLSLLHLSCSLTYFRPDYEKLKHVISSWFDPGTVQIRWLKSWKDFYNGQIISGRRYGVPVTLELKKQFGRAYSVFSTENK